MKKILIFKDFQKNFEKNYLVFFLCFLIKMLINMQLIVYFCLDKQFSTHERAVETIF